MYSSIKKLIGILQPDEKKELIFVGFLMTIMGGLELIGISLILPFMSVMAKPSLIQENKYFILLSETIHFSSHFQFIMFLGSCVIVVTVFSSLMNIYTNHKIFRFTEASSSHMATALLNEYLRKPYAFFLMRSPPELTKNVLNEVNQVTSGVLLPFLQGSSKAILLLILFGFTLWFNFLVSISVIAVFGLSYSLIYLMIRTKLIEAGKSRLTANRNKHHVVSKVFGGIKEVKLLESTNLYVDDFRKSFNEYAKCQVQQQIYGITPRYLLEIVAFGGIIIFTLIMYYNSPDFQSLLPTLSFFALVGYKCLPALQTVYNSITKMKFHLPAVEVIYKDMPVNTVQPERKIADEQSLQLNQSIRFNDISFRYETGSRDVLDHLSLEIKAYSIVGFVGTTGAGKTTLVDVMMGLLTPKSGTVFIDEVPLTTSNIKHWHKNIGYVPQRIYLSDDTVIRNIAFGEDESKVDLEKIYEVAKLAQIHDFIMSDLSQGYQTKIGDRGIRLSGGQSQRIGIARALYRNPKVLILDEATSALDNITEAGVIDTIKGLNKKCTIIMIAHRLSTVENCDKIFFLDKGNVLGEGTYSDLLKNVPAFRELQSASHHIQS